MSATSKLAVEIYRGPDRLRFYRGFGLFCLGHAVIWTGLTFYRGWYDKAERTIITKQAKELSATIGSLFSRSTEVGEPAPVAEQASSPEPISEAEHKPSSKIEQWVASIAPRFTDFSLKTKKYDVVLIPVFTSLFAIFTFGMGFILPRRIVRRITIFNVGPGTSKWTEKQTVEIQTYGAWGFRRQGITFRVPLSDISAVDSRSEKTSFIHFFVRRRPFRFIVEKSGAEFPLPDEYDLTFALQRKS